MFGLTPAFNTGPVELTIGLTPPFVPGQLQYSLLVPQPDTKIAFRVTFKTGATVYIDADGNDVQYGIVSAAPTNASLLHYFDVATQAPLTSFYFVRSTRDGQTHHTSVRPAA